MAEIALLGDERKKLVELRHCWSRTVIDWQQQKSEACG